MENKKSTPSPIQTKESPNCCWKRIGVFGDNTCSALLKYNHCQNCPVFKSETKNHPEMNIELDQSYILPESINKENSTSFTVFKEGEYIFAFHSNDIKSIEPFIKLHSLPNSLNPSVLGITNINESTCLIIDLKEILGLEKSNSKLNKMLVTHYEDSHYAFSIDDLIEIKSVPNSEIQSIDPNINKRLSRFIINSLTSKSKRVYILDHQLIINSLLT